MKKTFTLCIGLISIAGLSFAQPDYIQEADIDPWNTGSDFKNVTIEVTRDIHIGEWIDYHIDFILPEEAEEDLTLELDCYIYTPGGIIDDINELETLGEIPEDYNGSLGNLEICNGQIMAMTVSPGEESSLLLSMDYYKGAESDIDPYFSFGIIGIDDTKAMWNQPLE